MTQSAPAVTVFSTPTCPWCQQVKRYLSGRGVSFREVDVSRDRLAAELMVQKSKQQGVPQLWIDGKVVVGFDRPLIDQYLDLRTDKVS